jgi:hypothetical protein
MKPLQVITIAFVVSIFGGCASTAHISGRYTNASAEVAGEEFRFIQEPNKFEHYSRTEGGVKSYSSGTWMQKKKAIILNGFDDKNINVLKVESKVEDYPNENKNEIVVQYKDDPLDTFTKVDIIVNGSSKVRVTGDTAFLTAPIITLQVKSYLVHEGILLGTPPHIDTLYSPEIKFNNRNEYKRIFLNFGVTQTEFYRAKLTDTMVVKNSRTLIPYLAQ